MEKTKAFALVRSLMDEHGLTMWKLEWMHRKTTAGLCYNNKLTWNKKPELSRGRIAISSVFAAVFDEKEMRNLALHEIAHALVHPSVHHGPEWKAMARKIGCSAERCLTREESVKVEAPYKGTCPQGHIYTRHRKSYDMGGHSHYCPPCKKKKLDALIIWTDTRRGVILNPRTPKKPEPVKDTKILVTTMFEPKTQPRVRVAATKTAPTWKDRYDKGDTSFADVW